MAYRIRKVKNATLKVNPLVNLKFFLNFIVKELVQLNYNTSIIASNVAFHMLALNYDVWP